MLTRVSKVSQAGLCSFHGLCSHGCVFVAASQEQSLRNDAQHVGSGLRRLGESSLAHETQCLNKNKDIFDDTG